MHQAASTTLDVDADDTAPLASPAPGAPPDEADPGNVTPDETDIDKPLPEGHGLKRRAAYAGAWSSGGYAVSQFLRFASNIALSYLLVPEHFGLMALVNTVVTGLLMFSDIGIGPSLIQNKREDAAFHDTAWTIQVFRGFALWIVASLAAYPLSLIEGWGPLLYLLPVASLTTVIAGFQSTAWFTASRNLDVKTLAILEFISSIVRIAVMVGFAYAISRSAWALVVGVLVGSLIQTVLSFYLTGGRNRFFFEREAFGELIRYGRWLFISTIITFFAGQLDKFLLGGLLSPAFLGLYWIGLQMAELGPQFFKKLGGVVGFPAMSELYRRDQDRYRMRLKHLRLLLVVPINALLLFMILFGPAALGLIYQGKSGPFVESGWILQVLAFNSLAGMLNTSYGYAYMASGHTFANMITVAAQLAIMVVTMLGGYYLYGETGFILGIGISQWIKYPVDMVLADRIGVWQARLDVPVLIGSGLLALAAVWGSDLIVRSFML